MQNALSRPIFLERRSYRLSRMMDAVRLLPLLGFMLWLLPTLWTVSDADGVEPVKMSQAIKYVFGVWLVMIACCGIFWRFLVGTGQPSDRTGNDPSQGSD